MSGVPLGRNRESLEPSAAGLRPGCRFRPVARGILSAPALASCLLLGSPAVGAADTPEPTLPITRITTPIRVDGDLSDEGWSRTTPVDTWFETNPGDNTPPPVRNVGRLAYDERYLYVGFEFEDPNPRAIRAPLGDRDALSGTTDYGGVILDTRNDGRTAVLLLANARGLQYDAITDDGGAGEDSSPDFYWDAAGRITSTGWTLEIRVPFSSLRYPKADPQTWGVMLYRNYPRDFRGQFFTNKLPHGSSCFVCHASRLQLVGLPSGGHLVAAPYLSGRQTARPADGAGTPLKNGSVHGEGGLDLKWMPSASTALDATVNPDFSQVESDVAQISANERFALFYPEKRPFFLEGIDLFSTPLQAVYTRSVTAPRFGARGTGKWGRLAFTGLVADDQGGGQVILPGPNGSSFADQDFRSFVAVGRARRDFGASFVSFLVSGREQSGGAFNRVIGPDFQWRPNKRDTITGQLLWSFTRTPVRPDLSSQWDGRSLDDHAADVWWARSTPTYDVFGEYKDVGQGFRADNGFVPQVGYRRGYLETGYTWRPKNGLIRRLRAYLIADGSFDRQGDLLSRQLSPGIGFDARWNTFVRIRYAWDRVRAGEGKTTLPRGQLLVTANTSPSGFVGYVGLDGYVGSDVDFDGGRRGSGGKATFNLTLRPSNHLELRADESLRWLNVDAQGGVRPRLLTARVDRLRATYTLTARAFVRLIGQYVSTRRDPVLYQEPVDRRETVFTGSALLAYKLNWQTVLYAGFGDNRELVEEERLRPVERQLFVKLSYAFQR